MNAHKVPQPTVARQKSPSAEEQLRFWSKVLESSAEGIMVSARDGTILTVNRAFSDITGYSAEEAVGRNPRFLKSGEHPPEFYALMWGTILGSGRWQGEIWNRRKNGELFPEWLSISAVRDDAGEAAHFIAIFTDITERKASADRIQFLATHDALTGLPNRSLMDDLLRAVASSARRKGVRLGLLFLDLDRFKTVNDSLGHHAGDLLLQQVAKRIAACLREGDTVARLGGDEFLVLLPEISRSEDGGRVAEKILESLRLPITVHGVDLVVTPSIGIAIYPYDGEDPQTLQKNADAAMYHAKSLGRNNYQYFTPEMNVRAFAARALESSLKRAADQNEFLIVYEPQVEIRSGRIVGLSALIRWRHPERGLLVSEQFLPAAEEHGLIARIGEWTLHEACRQARLFKEVGLPPLPIAVSVSSPFLRQPGFPDRLRQMLEEAGVDGQSLELELTENAWMRDGENLAEVARSLKAIGLRLSIGEFGTGYTSLAALQDCPIDRLKIHRSFIRDVPTRPEGAAVIRTVISLGRNFHLGVIADGVETAEQTNFLLEARCDAGQGTAFHPAIEPSEVPHFLRTHEVAIRAGSATG